MDFGAVANDLGTYGLETVLWIPQKGEGNDKVQIGGGRARPLVRVANLDVFVAKFPGATGIVVASLDGSSIRVALQAKVRAEVIKNRNISDHDLVVAELQRLAGIRSTPMPSVESVLDSAPDDALIAALAKRRGISIEDAKALLELAAEPEEPEVEKHE